jgi:hypothetical protein
MAVPAGCAATLSNLSELLSSPIATNPFTGTLRPESRTPHCTSDLVDAGATEDRKLLPVMNGDRIQRMIDGSYVE